MLKIFLIVKTNNLFCLIIDNMICDVFNNLKKWEVLVPGIKQIEKVLPYTIGQRDSEFYINKTLATLFVVTKGSAKFTTTWRENLESDEITAVINTNKDNFVLYLPGEPILVCPDTDSKILKYNLE